MKHCDCVKLAWKTSSHQKSISSPRLAPKSSCPLPAGPHVVPEYFSLLTALGFRLAGNVRKRRMPGKMQWNGHLVILALDQVDGLGGLLELEISADDQLLEDAKNALQSLCAPLGMVPSERRSYLQLINASNT
jgi:adenylate cyclase class IV